MSICIAGYALLRVIHGIHSEYYFRNPDWYIKWLGMVDHQYLFFHLDLKTPLPSSLATPPPFSLATPPPTQT
jgi:hypothetical protein